MAKGVPIDWTLEQLQRIANRRDESAQVLADEFGCAYGTIYSMQKMILDAGSPEALYEVMKERAPRRYNRANRGQSRPKATETLAFALQRVYLLRVGAAGRGGSHPQVTVTIPGTIAFPFMGAHGNEVMYEVREEGILIKPALSVGEIELPTWMTAA